MKKQFAFISILGLVLSTLSLSYAADPKPLTSPDPPTIYQINVSLTNSDGTCPAMECTYWYLQAFAYDPTNGYQYLGQIVYTGQTSFSFTGLRFDYPTYKYVVLRWHFVLSGSCSESCPDYYSALYAFNPSQQDYPFYYFYPCPN